MTITRAQRQIVETRAGGCCEYCRMPESASTVVFHVDHIIPIKHEGIDDADNLCFACVKCNTHKGSDIGGFDPQTGDLTRLYHPRLQKWSDHFELAMDMRIFGRTPEGRSTVRLFRMNDDDRVEARQLLLETGDYPCIPPE